ncbi:hypothetical protein DVA67_021210 [Solirubrobacter sp. CPCC 204708]|uniref:DUF983 domain-containing protein n=1 Tax=Solirubrobacter deserti TaxID=2282478 RepID=A0ABT4RF33_9ACTN|nr:hypothetical protein [Solirubrobacter deserti]MBE2318513.1 hypothetical protein [Solirubrobacter deserti]MDA0136971.1 hypothetical protein [Solirubrobacter deserti]
MFRRKATAPDGSRWTLGRRWLPRRKRMEGVDTGSFEFPDLGSADDILGAILLVVFGAIAILFLIVTLFNVVVLAIELTILILGLILGLFARVVLRKPWTVFAKSGPWLEERQVVGWRASRRLLDELAGEIESGRLQLALDDRRRLDD